jgi:benzaldehyde dehydrogenase (NAD)
VTRADPKDGGVASQPWQNNDALAPFGGTGRSGLGGRSGGDANIEEFTERRWLTVNTAPAHYPY